MTVLASVLFVLPACTSPRVDGPRLQAWSDGGIGDIVWTADGWIFYTLVGASSRPDELWRTNLAGALHEVRVDWPECPHRPRLHSAFRVDGQLGLAAGCGDNDPSTILLRHEDGRFSLVVRAPYVVTGVAAGSPAEPWLVEHTDHGCRALSRLASGSFIALEPVVGDTGLTFAQGHDVAVQPCQPGVEVGWPATDARAAAVVRHDWESREGPDRRFGPAKVFYGADLDHPLRPVGDDFEEVQQTALIGPANSRIIVCAVRHLEDHLWAVDVTTGDRVEVGLCRYGVFAVSPDVRSAAVVQLENGRQALAIVAIPTG